MCISPAVLGMDMKCIQNLTDPEEVYRVSEYEARCSVSSGRWRFVPKLRWKESGRKRPDSGRLDVERRTYNPTAL